ncbi:MAG TPA: serine/threonine-protein kinase [Anaerolineales bacterium]|nr:serine/threonine-protein kinase [Anaerolineales bacterium]
MLGLIGKTISHYHILDQIGQGGMSSVFHAVDLNNDRAVAIKILSPYIAHEARFKARFEREIKLLRRLQHPNIMPILDFGETEGLAFIVMPYVGSGTLHEKMAKGPLDPKDGARIVGQLASALEMAHQAGVVHRDVKPSNILLDPMGNVLLSDFSFAHQNDASQNLTGSALIGTPSYMSPEQCRGEPIDARSDQYAFAVILYQMTTGRLPFEADTPMAIALKHVNEPLPRPSLINPSLPDEIEMVLVKGLAKDPALRYASVMALSNAFQEAMEIALDPARRSARTQNIEKTTAIYNKYQNVKPEPRRRWFERSAVLAALLLLIACPASAAATVYFYPDLLSGGVNAAEAPVDVEATVFALLTANAPALGGDEDPGSMQTAVYAAVVQTLQATGAPLDEPASALAAGFEASGTPLPTLPGGFVFPTIPATGTSVPSGGPEATATRTKTLAPGETPPTPAPTPTPSRTSTPGPSPTSSPGPSPTSMVVHTATPAPGSPTPTVPYASPSVIAATMTSEPTSTNPPPATSTPQPPPTNTPRPVNPNACNDNPSNPNYCTPTPGE